MASLRRRLILNSELTRPDGRKLLYITVAAIAFAIFMVLLMQTVFSSTPTEDVVDEDTDSDEETETTEDAHETVIPEEDITITVSAVGDITIHDAQLNSMFDNETSDYNFDPAFDKIQSILSASDLTIGNMNGVFAGAENTHSGYPSFNTPDALADTLSAAGFDLLVGANATAMNFGFDGVSRTQEVMTNAGIDPVGIYNADDSHAVYKEVDGILIAFVAYSENIDGYNNQNIPFEEAAERVGIMNEDTINADLDEVRSNNPDFIFAYMNWGEEFQYDVTEMQEQYINLLADNGVDVVVGSYPKNIQRTQYVTGSTNPTSDSDEENEDSEEAEEHETFVAYSLGNFFSNQRRETLGDGYEPTEDGVIMNFEITKAAGTGDTTLSDVEFIPTWTYRHSENNQVPFTYDILPVEETLADDDSYNDEVMGKLNDSLVRTEVRLNMAQARSTEVEPSTVIEVEDNVEADDEESSDEDVDETEDGTEADVEDNSSEE